ncbi:MAG: hypothetical protein M0Z65_11710 [Firmicutes bacterium]|uniref:Uncharacterized protein n=1 Tax=Melghirimyces thermohalophilus TaxID=1236220 RepID=A0A1G6NV82_9BACL|nr:hypothetical protein [Bacillota bacterium]SDC71832.1 hypothetical protein SAMN04488112_11460 [Melghirimyces thermohalophilus]
MEAASGGSRFLDKIGREPLFARVNLLRVGNPHLPPYGVPGNIASFVPTGGIGSLKTLQ